MKKKYNTTLNTRPFLYRETKMIAELIDQGLTDDVIKEKVIEDNVFRVKSIDRRERFFKEIENRLNELDNYLLEEFIKSDTTTSKIILLYGILSKDTLFYEWMREVVFDKWLTLDYIISRQDTLTFFENKVEQNETVKKWKEVTLNRLANAYHQTLVDADYASNDEKGLRLHRPIIAPNVEQYLKNEKEKHIVELLLGEVIQ